VVSGTGRLTLRARRVGRARTRRGIYIIEIYECPRAGFLPSEILLRESRPIIERDVGPRLLRDYRVTEDLRHYEARIAILRHGGEYHGISWKPLR